MIAKFNNNNNNDYNNDDNVKDVARRYMNLANNNDINTILTMMTNDTVCYGNVGIENVEKGMIAFHHSLQQPFWYINNLNIKNSDQLLHVDNFKNSHICNRKDLIHIEVDFTRYWTVDSVVEIANAIEIISINKEFKIVSIMYSQLPVKAESTPNNKYPDEYTGIIQTTSTTTNKKINVIFDDRKSDSDVLQEWYEYFTDDNIPYYFNVESNESTWEQPIGNVDVYKQYQDGDGNWYFLCEKTGISLWV